jgi:hypothetical protein
LLQEFGDAFLAEWPVEAVYDRFGEMDLAKVANNLRLWGLSSSGSSWI